DCLGEEGPVVGIVVDGEQDRAWFQLRLATEQGADGLDQVLTGAELAARPGRPWPEVADEAIGPRGERAFAFIGIDLNAGRQQHRNVGRGRVALEDLADAQTVDPAE